MHYIFRKADGVHLATAHRSKSLFTQLAAVLTNEGGHPDDYVIAQHPDGVPHHMSPALDADRQVVFILNPIYAAKMATRDSAVAKLTALGLAGPEISQIL